MSKLEEIKQRARAKVQELEEQIDLYDSAHAIIDEIETKIRRELEAEYIEPWWVRPLIERAVKARETGDTSLLPTWAEAQCDFVWPMPAKGQEAAK